MGSVGFPRWMGSRGDFETTRERCYSAVLDRLICAANAENAKCMKCDHSEGCESSPARLGTSDR